MENNRTYFGVFFISLAALAFEICLIRFFSISMWYHFAFMVVSIALFGIAASGTFLTLKKLSDPLYVSSILFSASVLFAFWITNNLVFDPFNAVLNPLSLFVLPIFYLTLGLPFFFFGLVIAHCFTTHQDNSGKVYFFNMSGSAVGTLFALLLIAQIQAKAIVVISLMGLISALFFEPSKYKLTALLICINVLFFSLPFELKISKYKELEQALNVPNSTLLTTRFNSSSRVDVIKSSFTRYAPGLSPTFGRWLPEQIGITIDGGNMNAITKYEKLDFVDHLPSSIPYFVNQHKKTLIINSGAGLDVLAALKNKADVTAIEANPLVIDLLKNEYAEYSGNIFNRAKVIQGEGRSALKEKFDIIVVSLAGNVLSGAAGISGLNENYLLTEEAFSDYYEALQNNGLLVVTRWLTFPPRESLRLFSLALTIDQSAKKVALFRSWTTVTLLLSKNDLSAEKTEKIKQFCENNKFDLISLPADFTPNKNLVFDQAYYFNAINSLRKNKEEFYLHYLFDVRATTDDRPFYFNFFKISKLKELRGLIGQRWNPFFDSGILMFFILVQALLMTLLFILLPIKHVKKGRAGPLGFFFAIGISYLFIEIVLIQKFILFFGQAFISSAVVIFSVLLSSSVGAWYSQRITKPSKAFGVLLALIIVYAFLIDYAIGVFPIINILPKILFTIVLIAPLGFMMGFPFPLGVRSIKKDLIPWSWAVNGSASVISSALAVLIALYFGYNFVFILAGLIYVCGFISLRLSRSEGQTSLR